MYGACAEMNSLHSTIQQRASDLDTCRKMCDIKDAEMDRQAAEREEIVKLVEHALDREAVTDLCKRMFVSLTAIDQLMSRNAPEDSPMPDTTPKTNRDRLCEAAATLPTGYEALQLRVHYDTPEVHVACMYRPDVDKWYLMERRWNQDPEYLAPISPSDLPAKLAELGVK